MAHSLGFYGAGISLRVFFSQLFGLRVLPGGALFSQDRCQGEGFQEVSDTWCLLLTFPELFRLVVDY